MCMLVCICLCVRVHMCVCICVCVCVYDRQEYIYIVCAFSPEKKILKGKMFVEILFSFFKYSVPCHWKTCKYIPADLTFFDEAKKIKTLRHTMFTEQLDHSILQSIYEVIGLFLFLLLAITFLQ